MGLSALTDDGELLLELAALLTVFVGSDVSELMGSDRFLNGIALLLLLLGEVLPLLLLSAKLGCICCVGE